MRNSSSGQVLRCAIIISSMRRGTSCIRSRKISWRLIITMAAHLRLRSTASDAMPRLEVAGASLHYDSAGRGEAVVLISGLGGLASFWQAQIEAFSPFFRTISFDHRGVGRSKAVPPYAMEQWAADIIAILDHSGIDRAHLVGHS